MRPPDNAWVLRHAYISYISQITQESSSVSWPIPRAARGCHGSISGQRTKIQFKCVQTCFGSFVATHSPTHTTMNSTTYTRFPPKMLFVTENAKSESAAAGPNVR